MNTVKMGFTIEEAAECTGIGRNTMRKLVDWGKLPVLKVGRKTIIRRDTLERFMTVNQGRKGISPLRGACITACKAAAAVIQRKLLPQFSLAAPLSNAVGTAAAGKPVAK